MDRPGRPGAPVDDDRPADEIRLLQRFTTEVGETVYVINAVLRWRYSEQNLGIRKERLDRVVTETYCLDVIAPEDGPSGEAR